MIKKLTKKLLFTLLFLVLITSVFVSNVFAWSNGGYSDDPSNPDYGTHDWIAQHALDWLPSDEKEYIENNLAIYLYGTELPDNGQASDGIGDYTKHHIYFFDDGTLQDDSSADRALEEYNLALSYLNLNDIVNAAKHAGIMTHYIADLAVFGHVMGSPTDWGSEQHHSDYENYVNSRTNNYNDDFNIYLSYDGSLDAMIAYDAAVNLAYDTTFDVDGDLTCVWMDQNYDWNNPTFKNRCGESLNLAVNYLTDVLHTLYVNSVSGNPNLVLNLEPNADASVDGKYHWENFGSSTTLSVCNLSSPYDYYFISFLKFDLSTIPTSAEIISAELFLRVKEHSVDSNEASIIGVHHYSNDSWNEDQISWDTVDWNALNRTSLDENEIYVDKLQWQVWFNWTVTSNVKKATVSSLSFALMAENHVESIFFYSRETTMKPYLKVTYSVIEEPPEASFTYLPNTDLSKLVVINFEDSSTDIDGTIVSWLWDFGDSTTSSDSNPIHRYRDKGTYTVQLTVTDNDGYTDTTTQSLTIQNLPPTAGFTYSPESPTVQQNLSFTEQSEDPEGKTLFYLWDFGDGSTSTERNPIHSYAESGTYTVKLTVTDDEEATDAYSVTITIIKNSSSLICSVSKSEVTGGESVTVSGTIDPALSEKTVLLSYKKPDGASLTRTITTGSDGFYNDSYTPDADGSWSVTASWSGDSTCEGASSSEVEFTVNTSLIGGPGWIDYIAVIGGIVIIVIIGLLLIIRRQTSFEEWWSG